MSHLYGEGTWVCSTDYGEGTWVCSIDYGEGTRFCVADYDDGIMFSLGMSWFSIIEYNDCSVMIYVRGHATYIGLINGGIDHTSVSMIRSMASINYDIILLFSR